MTATDPIPSSNHDKESFWSQELVEYNDGALNLRFEGDGDKIVWGMHKYAQRPEGPTSDEVIKWKSLFHRRWTCH